MATLIIAALVVTGLAWSIRRETRAFTEAPSSRIARLEAEYRRAHELGDVARADQLEAELRDTPGSGWARSERTS